MKFGLNGKRGQVAIFIIIAIAIVVGIALFFVFRGKIIPSSVPADFQEVINQYQSCIEKETKTAIDLAESQGGRIYLEPYMAGSDYAPFSNHLNFMGFAVPYWFYIAGNGVVNENVPQKIDIEADIARYIEENVNNCDFEEFYTRGFYVDMATPTTDVTISNTKVDVSFSGNLAVSREDGSAQKGEFAISVASNLGKFYATARDIYDKQRTDAFLETYAVDVLRLYAPVDGVDLSCSGKTWKTREVVDELMSGLEANIGALKFSGSYYDIQDTKNKYFVVDQSVDVPVRALYSKSWPSRTEIYGTDGELMVATPVGNQPGMGLMGFCYSPYHFVYDLSFPVLFQIYEGQEIFQFPVVVIIDKNVPRQAYLAELEQEGPEFDLCEFMTQDVSVNVYDVQLNPVDANITFECFNQRCPLGETNNGQLEAKAPACVNGYMLAQSEGYANEKVLFSSNEETLAEIVMDKEYEVDVKLNLGGKPVSNSALISFVGKRSVSVALPDANNVKMSEGLYNVTVYVYGNSTLTLPATTSRVCNEIPKSGLLGFFGGTRQECYDIQTPETKIDSALIGGGIGNGVYIFESDLKDGELIIDAEELPIPTTLDELQLNYAAFEGMNAGVEG